MESVLYFAGLDLPDTGVVNTSVQMGKLKRLWTGIMKKLDAWHPSGADAGLGADPHAYNALKNECNEFHQIIDAFSAVLESEIDEKHTCTGGSIDGVSCLARSEISLKLQEAMQNLESKYPQLCPNCLNRCLDYLACQDAFGRTPLHFAVMYNQGGFVSYLMDAESFGGAVVQKGPGATRDRVAYVQRMLLATTFMGETPLHFAARYDRHDLIFRLISYIKDKPSIFPGLEGRF